MFNPKDFVWTEKYRPKKVNDIVGDFKDKITTYLKNPESMPHFLFFSRSPGTGKTTLAKAISNELGCDIVVINSSDDRGIEAIREKVKEFAKTKSSNGMRRCIFLDEIDGSTRAAQDSLRNIMESFASNAFFILTCVNEGTRIYLPNGYKRVENVKKENILTNNNTLENQNTILRKKEKIIEIETVHGQNIQITPEHKFLIDNKWINAEDLKINDKIDINLDKIFGKDIELENNKYNIFNDEFKKNFILFLKENKIPTQQLINELIECRKKNILPQEIDLLNKMELNKEYSMRDIEKLDNYKVSFHRYQLIFFRTKHMGFIKTVGNNRHTRYIKINNEYENNNFYVLLDKLNNKYKYNYNTKELYNMYKHHTGLLTIEELLIRLEKILNICSLDYEKIEALGRLIGFIYGDGHLGGKQITIHFAGNKECITLVKKDLELFFNKDFLIRQNGKNLLAQCIVGSYEELYYFFKFIGCPSGEKVKQKLFIPKICYTNKLLLKSFLQSLFDCESLKMKINNKTNMITPFVFGQHSLLQIVSKKKDVFFNEIQYVLKKYFEIDSYIKYEKAHNVTFMKKFNGTKEERVVKKLFINKQEEQLKLMLKIGNYYEQYKKQPDLLGYLMYKQQMSSFGYNNISYSEWKNIYYCNGILKDVIKNISIREGEFNVYDLSLNEEHSYISNGFISHNCNNINKVSEAIQSRCVCIPFAYPNKDEIKEYLKMICTNENLQFDDSGLNEVLKYNYPSIRNCVICLQDLKTEGKIVTKENIKPINSLFEEMWSNIKKKEWKQIKTIVMESTLDARELNTYFWEKSLEEENLKIIQICCRNEKDISTGADANIIVVTSLIEMVK